MGSYGPAVLSRHQRELLHFRLPRHPAPEFPSRLNFTVVAEDLRAWRISGYRYAIAQALRPAGSIQFAPTRNWSVQASVAYSRNMGAHVYDAVQSGFAISYAMPVHRAFKDDGREVDLQYPIRFSAGMQQETFF